MSEQRANRKHKDPMAEIDSISIITVRKFGEEMKPGIENKSHARVPTPCISLSCFCLPL